MSRFLIAILLIVFSFSNTNAQTDPAEKKLEKVYALIEKNKVEKAGNELKKILEEYSSYCKSWTLLEKITPSK